jgi:hypothetical protein
MKTNQLLITFAAVTAFDVGCKSAAPPGWRRTAGKQADQARIEVKEAVPNLMESCRPARWPPGRGSCPEQELTTNRVAAQILAERRL